MVTFSTISSLLRALFNPAFFFKRRSEFGVHSSARAWSRRCLLFLLLCAVPFVTVGRSEANIEATLGTRFILTGPDPGSKRPQVYVELEKKPGVVKKIYATVEAWSDTSITCLWTKPLSPGNYDLWVKPGIKGAEPVVADILSVASPVIDNTTPDILSSGAKITLNGRFFTNKKPVVYLKDLVSLERKNCKVLNFSMDPATGVSSLIFVMPQWTSGNYNLNIKTQVGETSFAYPPGPLDQWHLRNPVSGKKVTFGNGLFISVGKGIFTSTDGVRWNERLNAPGFNDVTFGADVFVAVGEGGTILTSKEGVSWISSTSRNVNTLYGIAYGKGIFIAVGDNGVILTSHDGVSWTSRRSGTTDTILGVTYGDGLFAAVGTGGTILTSRDGIRWTSRNVYPPDNLYGVTYANGQFTAVGESLICGHCIPPPVIYASADGVEWTPGQIGGASDFHGVYGVTYGNGLFVAVGRLGTVLTSPDGVSWTAHPPLSNQTLEGVTFGGGFFIAVGYENAVLTSPDGVSWTSRLPGPRGVSGVTYGNGTFIAVGGSILSSTDGISWTVGDSGDWKAGWLNRVTYSNGIFVAVGYSPGGGGSLSNSHAILTSPDGVLWTVRECGPTIGLNGAAYGNGVFVAVGPPSPEGGFEIYRSSDGILWTPENSGSYAELDGVTWGSGKFVAVGFGGTILTSSDGISWTPGDSGTTNWLRGVSYGDGVFVAVGDDGTILISTDGVKWASLDSGIINGLYDVTHGDNSFVAVGDKGLILTSADGSAWSLRRSGTTERLSGVTYGDGSFLIVGDNGTIIQSGAVK